jgi:hypothetical protein
MSVGKLQTWLDGGGNSPNEQVAKSRLREILAKVDPWASLPFTVSDTFQKA